MQELSLLKRECMRERERRGQLFKSVRRLLCSDDKVTGMHRRSVVPGSQRLRPSIYTSAEGCISVPRTLTLPRDGDGPCVPLTLNWWTYASHHPAPVSSAIPGQSPCGGRRSEPVKLELPRDEPGGLEPCLALHFSSPLLLFSLATLQKEVTKFGQKCWRFVEEEEEELRGFIYINFELFCLIILERKRWILFFF